MEKPEKKKYEHIPICFNEDWNNGRNVGFNNAIDLSDKYHVWDKKQNYVRKDRLSVKIIQQLMQLMWNHFEGTELKKLLNGKIDCLDLATKLSKELKEQK